MTKQEVKKGYKRFTMDMPEALHAFIKESARKEKITMKRLLLRIILKKFENIS